MGRHAIAAVLLAGALLAVAYPLSPVHVSYVYSDSMEPTIGEYDGFVVVPSDGVETGDVVTFWSNDKDEYVTHRVVGRTDGGFVTRGDANRVSDQRAGHPPVARDQIRGEVLAVGGEPLVIPGLGRAVMAVRGASTLVLAGVALVAGALALGSGGGTERRVDRWGAVGWPVLGSAVLALAVLLVAGVQTVDVSHVAVAPGIDAGGPGVVSVGKPITETVRVGRSPLQTTVFDPRGVSVVNRTANATVTRVGLEGPPASEPGAVEASLDVYRYPAVLPRGVLVSLHRVHPAVAGAVTALVVLSPAILVYLLTVDGRSPVRPSLLGRRLRRWRERNG